MSKKDFQNGFALGLVSGGVDTPWYDFVVELTSDIANGAEFKDVLTPYLLDKMRIGKDVAFCTLLNANKTHNSDSTKTPLIWGMFRKSDNTSLAGFVGRYRSDGGILTTADATTGYGCVGLAGDKYYVKVVNVLE